MNEINDEIDSEEFKQLLEDSLIGNNYFSIGDKVSGTIIHIAGENAFVNISLKSEAIIDISEFKNKNDDITIKEGDTIEAYIVSTDGGEITLTSQIGKGIINPQLLEIAYELSTPVEGIPTEIIKGGYSVYISNIRCFCPFSQIDIKMPSNPEDLLNKTYEFRIIELSEKGKNIVLSRRVLLEEEKETKVKKLKNTLHVGDIIDGVISSIQNFGIFIDIGGVEALIPKSELSWSRNIDLNQFFTGNNINAKIIFIDWESNRITLSLKQLLPQPWENIINYSIGSSLNGRIVNIISHGAFVELEPGLEGFIHVSKISHIKRINKPEEVVSIGDFVNVKILEINPDEKRISLELLTGEPDPWLLPVDEIINNIQTGIIETTKPAGITIRLSNGMLGFIPREELLLKENSSIEKIYPVGSEISATVKEINTEKKRLILSEKGVSAKESQKNYSEFLEKNSADDSSTLGAQFKQKFDEIQKKLQK